MSTAALCPQCLEVVCECAQRVEVAREGELVLYYSPQREEIWAVLDDTVDSRRVVDLGRFTIMLSLQQPVTFRRAMFSVGDSLITAEEVDLQSVPAAEVTMSWTWTTAE